MKKKYIILALIALVIVIVTIFVYQTSQKQESLQTQEDLILYYGDTCPHCKIVEAFLKDNKIAEKINFSQKEVFLNASNSKDLSKKAALCKINPKEVGVPLLWNNGTCLVGDQDIINFFKDKTGIK